MERSRFIYNMAAILAIAPFYSFKKRALLKPNIGRMYAIVVAFLFTSARCYFYYSEFRAVARTWSVTRLLLTIFDELALVLMYCFHMLISCAFKQKHWLRMNNALILYDGALQKMIGSRRQEEPSSFILRHPTFFFYHLVNLALISYMGLIAKFWDTFRFVWYKLTFHPSFLIALMIQYLSLNFAARYRDLNSFLLENYKKHNTALVATNLRLLKRYFRVLRETVDAFNDIFGYSLFFTVAKLVAFSLRMAEVFIIRGDRMEVGAAVNTYLYIRIGVAILLCLGCTVIMVMSCDSVGAVQQKTRDICSLLEEKFEEFPAVRLEVEELSEFLRDNPAKVTAADFFDVDRTTVFDVFGIIVTYLIVILQFSELYY